MRAFAGNTRHFASFNPKLPCASSGLKAPGSIGAIPKRAAKQLPKMNPTVGQLGKCLVKKFQGEAPKAVKGLAIYLPVG